MAKAKMSAEDRAKVFKALADPHRVAIVDQLATGAQSGTQLADALGVSCALLCHHWEVLIDAGIIRKQRVGQLRMVSLDVERIREATGGWTAPAPPSMVRARRAR